MKIVLQLAITLFLAHLIGDFILQPSFLLKKKKQIFWMVIHCLIHGVLAYVLLANWKEWRIPIIVIISHFIIDFIKYRLNKEGLVLFLVDQLLHLTVIFLLVNFILIPESILPAWSSILPVGVIPIIVYISAFILIAPVGGIMIGLFVQPFQKQIKDHYKKITKPQIEGLVDGGRVIGWLERLLIFVFVLSGQYAGIGFLVAAKSIFRFGEFKESENRKEAEYIIIGTFASFLYAILISLLTKWILTII